MFSIERSTAKYQIWIIVVLSLLAFYRLTHNLAELTPWFDELWSASIATSSPTFAFHFNYEIGAQPPLYYASLYVWQGLAGRSVFILKMLSVLLAMISIAIMFRLAKKLFNTHSAYLALVLFIISDFILRFGRELTGYMLGILLCMATYWTYILLIEKPSAIRAIRFIFLGVLAAYTHYFAIIALFAIGLHAVIRHRKQLRTFVIMAICYLPWVPVWHNQTFTHTSDGVMVYGNIPSNIEGFIVVTSNVFGQPDWLWLGLLAIAFVMLVIKKLETPYHGFLALTFITPYILIFIINHELPILLPRYLFIIMPLGNIAVAALIARTPKSLQGIVILTIIGTAISSEHLTIYTGSASFVNEANLLAQVVDEDDIVLVSYGGFPNLEISYHLKSQSNWSRQSYELAHVYPNQDGKIYPPDYFQDILGQNDGVWVIIQPWSLVDFRHIFEEFGWQQTANLPSPNFIFRTIRFDKVNKSAEPINQFNELALLNADTSTVNGTFNANLLWALTTETDTNYTVSIFLLSKDGVLVGQHDTYPQDGQSPTSTWNTDQFYYDYHPIDISDVPAGNYRVGIKVYRFLNDDFSQLEVISPSSCAPDCDFDFIGNIAID